MNVNHHVVFFLLRKPLMLNGNRVTIQNMVSRTRVDCKSMYAATMPDRFLDCFTAGSDLVGLEIAMSQLLIREKSKP